jgi:hypothetical protein
MRATATIAAPVLAAALLAGCQNETNSLTNAEPGAVPDLRRQVVSSDAAMAASGAVDLDGNPVVGKPARSTTTLARDGWAVQQLDQPRGQVEVQPWYHDRFEGFGDDARVRGDYPTTATALGTRGGVPTAVQEWWYGPVQRIFWIAATPVQAVAQQPLETVRTPDRDVAWMPASAAPAMRGAAAAPDAPKAP